MQLKVIGLNPVKTRLNNIVTRDKVKMAMVRGGFAVERDAKGLVKVDTGRLKNSISTVWKDSPHQTNVSPAEPDDMIKHHGSDLNVYIGTNTVYAAAQEYGRTDMKQYSYKPFLRPAFRKNRKTIMKEVKKTIEGKT